MDHAVAVSELVPRRSTYPELGLLLQKVEAIYGPDDILLFGSRAKGTARRDSDWDVLVLLPDAADEALLDPLLAWEAQQGTGVKADVLCAYTTEFRRDMDVANSRTREIVDHAVRIGTR